MKILVTGGTGFIGSFVAVELIKAGHEVEIVDNLCNSKESTIDRIEEITSIRPKFHKLDLCDAELTNKLFEDNSYDAVIHLAGLKSVSESIEKPELYHDNNVGSASNVIDAMRSTGVKFFVFSSSATVYGNPGVVSFTEDLPTGKNLSSPYGESKYEIEQMLKSEAERDRDFHASLLRYFNPIGADPSGKLGEEPNGRPNNLMPIIMKVAKGDIPELSVYGNDYPTPDGTCIRDYIHVIDLAKGHLAALEHLVNNPDDNLQIYNLGSGKGTSVLEMISAFENASGEKLPYKIVDRRPGDLPEFYADPTKAEKELGWRTELTIDDAMRDTINYLNNN